MLPIHRIGAELFAKRRKRSEKWIVDETSRSANNPSATSYSAGPAQIYDTTQMNQANQTNQYNQSSYIDQVWMICLSNTLLKSISKYKQIHECCPFQTKYEQSRPWEPPVEKPRNNEFYQNSSYTPSNNYKPNYQPPAPAPIQSYTLPKVINIISSSINHQATMKQNFNWSACDAICFLRIWQIEWIVFSIFWCS